MNSPKGKELLALIRKGNYAHPGEEEAIDLVFEGYIRDPGKRILDAGCGRGGTASYIQEKGLGTVCGIDIDPSSIDFATKAYPMIRFFCYDICSSSSLRQHTGKFDVICMLTSLYAIQDQQKALSELRMLVDPGSEILVFDYSSPGAKHVQISGRPEHAPWFPVPVTDAPDVFGKSGWDLIKILDISEHFIKWYTWLVDRIFQNKDRIILCSNNEWFDFMHGFYSGLLKTLEMGKTGGAIFHAAATRSQPE